MASNTVGKSSIVDSNLLIPPTAITPQTGFTILDMLPEILALFSSHLSISQSSRLLTTCKTWMESRFVEPIEARFRRELQGEADQFFPLFSEPISTLPRFTADVRAAICGFELLRAQRTQKHVSIIAFRMFSLAELRNGLPSYFKLELKDRRFPHFTDTFIQALEVSARVRTLRQSPSFFNYGYSSDLAQYDAPSSSGYMSNTEISWELLKSKNVFEAAEMTMGFEQLAGFDVMKLIRGFCDGGYFWKALEFPEELPPDLQKWAYEELLSCLMLKGHPNLALELVEKKGFEAELISRAFESAFQLLMREDRFDEAFSVIKKIPDPKTRKWKFDTFINTLTSPINNRGKQFFTEAIEYTLKIEDSEVRESCFKTIEHWADSETKQKVADARNSSKS